MLNQAREALPETERRESPAASEAAAMVLMEVIGLKGMGGWGGVSPMNTPSPESMAEVMTTDKRLCDLAHKCLKAIKSPTDWRGH